MYHPTRNRDIGLGSNHRRDDGWSQCHEHGYIRIGHRPEHQAMTPSMIRPDTSGMHHLGKASLLRTVAVATLAGLALTLAACSSSSTSAPSTSAASSASSGAPAAGKTTIVIKGFAFSPNKLTVAPGATVTVTNRDMTTHTLTATKGGFDTGSVGPGQTKSFTAPEKPGTYPYICSIHQYMTGDLVVS
jgi:plastocyanin